MKSQWKTVGSILYPEPEIVKQIQYDTMRQITNIHHAQETPTDKNLDR